MVINFLRFFLILSLIFFPWIYDNLRSWFFMYSRGGNIKLQIKKNRKKNTKSTFKAHKWKRDIKRNIHIARCNVHIIFWKISLKLGTLYSTYTMQYIYILQYIILFKNASCSMQILFLYKDLQKHFRH